MRISKILLAIGTLMVLMSATLPSKEQRTSQAIQKVMDEFQAVGISAAIVKDGKIVYNESFGYKNLEEKTPLTNNDVMRIASISKSFTATGLLQLVDKGIISLDDDVSNLIGFTIRNPHHPDVPITLRMILSHTSSIRDKEDYFTLDHLNPAVYGDCIESYFKYKPGEGYCYSNMGLNLAGSILEKVSGVRFDDYVRTNVIHKLGLYGGHNVDSLDNSRIARIYTRRNGEYVESTGAYRSRANDMHEYKFGYSTPWFSPTGGVKISAHDLAVYMMMHMNYGKYNGTRIISKKSAKTMQKPIWTSAENGDEIYGLCLKEFNDYINDDKYNTPGHYPVGHTGGAYGLNSIMIWSPDDKWGIVAMTNGYTSVKGKSFLKELTNAIYNAYLKE